MILSRTNRPGGSSSEAAGHKSSICEPRIGSGRSFVRNFGRVVRMWVATMVGTVASIAVPSRIAPRFAKLEIEHLSS